MPGLFVAHVLDGRVRGRGDRRRAAHLDDLRSALGDTGDEDLVEPRIRFCAAAQPRGERRGHGFAAHHGVRDIRELRRGMVAPDRQPGDLVRPRIEGVGELADGPVVVEPRQGGEAVGRNVGGGCRGDQCIRVGGVSDDHHSDVICRSGVDRRALRPEDPGVRGQQVSSLHAGAARTCADQESDAAAVERRSRVVGDLYIVQQRKRAILEFEGGTLGAAHTLRDLEQLQPDRPIVPQHLAGGDPEQERIADLAAGTGDRDGGGHGGRCGGVGRHEPSLFRPSGHRGSRSA